MSATKRFLDDVKAAIAAWLGVCLGLLLLLCLSSAPAQAQNSRSWVSGVGADANPCSRTAPCLTFQGAYNKTNAGGEINCLDSGSYGTVYINHSVSIICEGVVAGMPAPGANGVEISMGAADIVVLRGLDIEGFGTGAAGVAINSGGGTLHIENCRIRNFNNVANGWGIQFLPASSAAELYVTDTTISHNGSASGGGGILVYAPGGSTSKVTVNQSNVQNNTFGIKADGTSGAGGVINMTIRDTASVGNSLNGIVGTSTAAGAAVVMMLDRVASSHNAVGFGIIADGPKTFINLGGSSIAGNANGVGSSNGGTLLSFKTNQIRGNGSDGTPIAAAGLD